MLPRFFFDTSAMIEYLSGNEEVKRRFQEGGITTKLHLMELYLATLEEFGPKEADAAWKALSVCAISFDDAVIKDAAKLMDRMRRAGLNLSFPDALGQTIAGRFGLTFVTADANLKGLPNVEMIT